MTATSLSSVCIIISRFAFRISSFCFLLQLKSRLLIQLSVDPPRNTRFWPDEERKTSRKKTPRQKRRDREHGQKIESFLFHFVVLVLSELSSLLTSCLMCMSAAVVEDGKYTVHWMQNIIIPSSFAAYYASILAPPKPAKGRFVFSNTQRLPVANTSTDMVDEKETEGETRGELTNEFELSFTAVAKSDITVAFAPSLVRTSRDPLIEIVIGATDNTKCLVGDREQTQEPLQVWDFGFDASKPVSVRIHVNRAKGTVNVHGAKRSFACKLEEDVLDTLREARFFALSSWCEPVQYLDVSVSSRPSLSSVSAPSSASASSAADAPLSSFVPSHSHAHSHSHSHTHALSLSLTPEPASASVSASAHAHTHTHTKTIKSITVPTPLLADRSPLIDTILNIIHEHQTQRYTIPRCVSVPIRLLFMS